MARVKSKDSRRSKAERKRADKAAVAIARLAEKGTPNAHVERRRAAFSFLGKGMIDQDVCDGIGQLKALGFLDGHGHDATDLRNVGRDYADLYWERYEATAPAMGQFERRSRGTGNPPPRNSRDDRFDRLDEAMPRISMERVAVHMLLTDHYHSDGMEGWVSRLINRELAARGIADVIVLLDEQTRGHDLHMLGCVIRGLCQLMDASLPARFERRAA